MPRGRSSISPYVIREIFILNGKGMTPNKIAQALKIAGNTVRKHLADKDNISKYSNLMNEIEQINENSNNKIIELVKSQQYSNIALNITELFSKDNLTEEFRNNGIRSLISLLGNTVDKTMALKRYEIQEREYGLKERTLAIKERELELKEKELNARLENPDAFSNIVIIDDTSLANKYYKDNGIEKQYADN